MDKICLSRAQILWGMFYKKNIDYVYLHWEDFMFQIEYKDAKKTNKMPYPRFTKIIIDYFMSKDQSILRRDKMFWHTARDNTMYTSMRCIFKHEKTQVYGTILPKELTNQAMLESIAYKTYYTLLLERKLQNQSDGVDTQSKVSDEQQQKTFDIDKGTSIILRVPDVPIYASESDKESWGDSDEEDDDEDDFEDNADNIDEDSDDNSGSEDHDDDSGDEKTESNRDEI
uniref:Uncharacterized protein n=1 Tax=Tanacetum cinerariifolium TaxID=118510 RepID=A0A6L2JFU8_TANCI|nr:hypothetical protein [Tanacetum cinerariifolium]